MCAGISVLRLEGGKKNFEAKSNPYYSSEFASRQGCLRTQGGQLLKARDCLRQQTSLQSAHLFQGTVVKAGIQEQASRKSIALQR